MVKINNYSNIKNFNIILYVYPITINCVLNKITSTIWKKLLQIFAL